MENLNHVLKALGIRRTYKGYYYLVDAIDIAIKDSTKLIFISKTLYPLIAKKYETSISCVERNIRTLVIGCWESKYGEILSEMAGAPLYERPTVGEFIDIISGYLSSQEKA